MKKSPPAKYRQSSRAPVRTETDRVAKTPTTLRSNVNLPFYLLFGFALLLYANSLLNQYTLDDRLMITENAFTKKGFSGIKDILTTDSFVGFFGKQKNLVAGGRYRPLSHITFAVEYGIFNGFNAFVGHLINILLYALACLLVYRVLSMLFPPGKKPFYLTFAFIATALFIAHPLHTEAVANVKGRDEIMSLLGSFGALYFILRYIQHSRPLHLLLASLVFFLGLLSKENAITFVAIIPLTLYFFTKATTRQMLVSSVCLLAIAAVFVVIRTSVLGFLLNSKIESELLNNPFIGATALQKYATILLTWGKYLLLLIFPHPLTHDYYPKQIPIINMGDLRAIVPLLIYAAMIGYALWRFKKKEIVAYSILLYGLTFSIQSNLVFPIGTFMNERFMFIPLLGLCLVLAYVVTGKFPIWLGKERSITATYLLIGIILLGYSVKTIARNPAWHDDYTLFTTDVKVSTNSAKCNISAGGQTMELAEKVTDQVKKKKMLDDALVYLYKGIKIYPNNLAGWVLLGRTFYNLENYKQSREYFEQALKINPANSEALIRLQNCAIMSNKNKDYKEAVISYNALLKYQPKNKDLYVNISEAYEGLNLIDSAVFVLKRGLKLDSNNVSANNRLGMIYGKYLGDINTSLKYLMKAYSISPTDGSLLENIGAAYGSQNNYAKSIEFFNKALALNPENSKTYLNLAGSYAGMGNAKKAADCKAKAAELIAKGK